MRIRSLLIGCGLIALAASPVAAQYSPMVMGVSIGATSSDFQSPDSDARWGFAGGLFLGKATYRTLTTLEVNYVQKGGEGSSYSSRLDYIEVPLTFGGVGRTRSGSGRARLYGGIAAAFKVTCASDISAACNNAESVEWVSPFGLMLSRYTEGERFVAIDVRYNIPLSRAFEGGAYNQNWQFKVIVGRSKN
jgi:hypothetical protein